VRRILVAGGIIVALTAGGIAVVLTLDEPQREEMPVRVTPSRDIELGRADPAAAAPLTTTPDIDSGSCGDHPADLPVTPQGSGRCAALTYNADGTCTLETARIENWRPVSVKRTIVRCP
jgi:hypothetical protein